MHKKCAIYARVSTKKDEQKSSLENQIQIGRKIAKDNNFYVVDTYIDDGISGSGYKNRQSIQDLVKDAKDKKFDVVISKSVSRLSRHTPISMSIAAQLEKSGVRLILPEDDYDTDTTKSMFMFNLKAVLAEEESAKLSERVKQGIRAHSQKGFFSGSLPPYGYIKYKKDSKLVVHDDEALIVKKIFDMYYYQCKGMNQIANHLTEQGIPTPKASIMGHSTVPPWQQSTISLILKNQVYIGNIVFGKSSSTRHLAESEKYRLRKNIPPADHQIIENAHEAIISEDLFFKVQAMMEERSQNKSNGSHHLFTHLIKCKDCGSGLTFRKYKKGGAYICSGYVKRTAKFCSSHKILEKDLLSIIRKELKKLSKTEVDMDKIVSKANKAVNGAQLSKKSNISNELSKLYKRADRLLDLYTNDGIQREQFKVKNEEIQKSIQKLNEQKLVAEAIDENQKNLSISTQVLKSLADSFLSLTHKDQDKLQSLLAQIIKSIVVSEDKNIEINFRLKG